VVPMLTLFGQKPRERSGDAIRHTVTVPAGRAGTSVRFRISLPSLVPSFTTVTHQLEWWLVARVGSLFGTKVDAAMPLEILDGTAASWMPTLVAPPRLGDERIAAAFARAAARGGWHGVELGAGDGDREGELAIAKQVAIGELSLAYAYRGEAGTFTIARIDHAPLGLGLSVEPSSALRELLSRDVEIDLAAWDRVHHVDARSSAQAVPFLQAVVPALMRADKLGALVRWSDTTLVCERPIRAIDADELVTMMAELEQLADALARGHDTLVPPPGLAIDLEAWRALARWLDGELVIGDLSIEGMLDGLPVSVEIVWAEDRAERVRAAVGDPEKAGEQLRRIVFALPHPSVDVRFEPAAEALVERVTTWPEQIVSLRVADGVASAARVIELDSSGSPAIDVADVRTLVFALRAVIATLAPGTGPYR
jgi:hypothetical protein